MSVILAFPAVYNVFVIFSNEYFESDDLNVDDISVEPSSEVPVALQLSWIALTAAFFSIVILVFCILYISSPQKKMDIENQVIS